MKYTIKPYPRKGTKRMRKGFLWFPRWIGLKIRWLEFGVWEEEWKREFDTVLDSWKWVATKWIDGKWTYEEIKE